MCPPLLHHNGHVELPHAVDGRYRKLYGNGAFIFAARHHNVFRAYRFDRPQPRQLFYIADHLIPQAHPAGIIIRNLPEKACIEDNRNIITNLVQYPHGLIA